MKKFSFLKRMGRCLLVLAVLFALVGADAAPLAETAEAVTQSDIDALKDNADDLADQKSEIKSQLASLRDEKANILAKRVLLDQQIAVTEKEIARALRALLQAHPGHGGERYRILLGGSVQR